ncbi:MAG: glycosyltransferase family 2 protein [Patescibacteria group bacterium]|jgi:glycosyltransferase involved in cell wall biosynthesis
MKPRLSIIVATCNREKSLKKCLASLSKQTKQNFEVIVIDGSSSNGTEQIVETYQKQFPVTLVFFQEPGLSRARDIGWRKAKGEFVAFIDDDVVVSSKWAESVVATLSKHPEVGGVSGPTIVPSNLLRNRDVFWFYNRTGMLKVLALLWNYLFLDNQPFAVGKICKSGAWTPGSNFKSCLSLKSLREVDYLEACNMTFQRNLVEKVGGFDLSFEGVGDWCEPDLAVRVKKLGYLLVFNPQARVDHHISRDGVFSRRNFAKARMENFYKFYFRHIFRLKPSYISKLALYVLFLNIYWICKSICSRNISWLSGIVGSITGLRYVRS